MNFNFSSGKKFQDSLFCYEGFEKLRKDELNRRILINILFVLTFLILEMLVFLVISKF